MSRVYVSQSRHIALTNSTAKYLQHVPEAITIMADIYDGPKYQRDIVQHTSIAGNRVKSVLTQLVNRGMLTKEKKHEFSQTNYYDLTIVAKLWLLQHYPESIQSKSGVTA